MVGPEMSLFAQLVLQHDGSTDHMQKEEEGVQQRECKET